MAGLGSGRGQRSEVTVAPRSIKVRAASGDEGSSHEPPLPDDAADGGAAAGSSAPSSPDQ